MTMGDQLPKGIEAIAASARPESLSPRPRAKPPATIQITLQLIDCRSFAVITPVSANTPKGIMATVLESMPVTLSSTQNKRNGNDYGAPVVLYVAFDVKFDSLFRKWEKLLKQ